MAYIFALLTTLWNALPRGRVTSETHSRTDIDRFLKVMQYPMRKKFHECGSLQQEEPEEHLSRSALGCFLRVRAKVEIGMFNWDDFHLGEKEIRSIIEEVLMNMRGRTFVYDRQAQAKKRILFRRQREEVKTGGL